jgi:hypothetical protein
MEKIITSIRNNYTIAIPRFDISQTKAEECDQQMCANLFIGLWLRLCYRNEGLGRVDERNGKGNKNKIVSK